MEPNNIIRLEQMNALINREKRDWDFLQHKLMYWETRPDVIQTALDRWESSRNALPNRLRPTNHVMFPPQEAGNE